MVQWSDLLSTKYKERDRFGLDDDHAASCSGSKQQRYGVSRGEMAPWEPKMAFGCAAISQKA